MNSLVVSGLVKRIYPVFNMSKFDDRVKLQKMIYLIQAYVVNLGFSFSLYLRGPYSPGLTKVAYSVEDFSKARPVFLEDERYEKKFRKFLNTIEPHKNDIKFLEIASTLHMVSKIYPNKDAVSYVARIKGYPKDEIRGVYEEMKKWKF